MSPFVSRARALSAAGVLPLAAATAALSSPAQAQTPAGTQNSATPQSSITAKLADRHIRYGGMATVTGAVTPATSGTPLTLEYRPRGGQWSAVAKVTSTDGGKFRFRTRLRRNGALRVVSASGDGATVRAASNAPNGSTSRALNIRVAATFRSTRLRRDVIAGRSSVLRGKVLPAGSGRLLRLQVRRGGRWVTVDRDRTSKSGAYRLRWKTSKLGRYTTRVKVSSTSATTSARRTLGSVRVYRRVFVSWYGPGFYGRRTACGGTLGYGTMGVAHKSLPCGTKLTLRKGKRRVNVRVIDRGPYVHGREYDLTGATKRALGFGSTGTILATR
ncbi:septal ring lytic transglycosylase RlpA family protein [Paraconexibacter sp.]|uniref:septal ring lytic transglycosylase RlpA family protein n=1 Tax=Paraconexibacter sp. TaxID=2949640 RepID=UPI003566B87A